jgi:hypothetical protein
VTPAQPSIPREAILRAALWSADATTPHDLQMNVAWLTRFRLSRWPHQLIMIGSAQMAQLGLPPMVVVIRYGRTEADIVAEMKEHLVTPSAVLADIGTPETRSAIGHLAEMKAQMRRHRLWWALNDPVACVWLCRAERRGAVVPWTE